MVHSVIECEFPPYKIHLKFFKNRDQSNDLRSLEVTIILMSVIMGCCGVYLRRHLYTMSEIAR
jgi:hypothetical protein